MTPDDNPHRRASDTSRLRQVQQLTGTALPPAMCIFLAAVVAHSVEMSPNHDITWPAATVAIAVLSASFGKSIFKDWLSHKERSNAASPTP